MITSSQPQTQESHARTSQKDQQSTCIQYSSRQLVLGLAALQEQS